MDLSISVAFSGRLFILSFGLYYFVAGYENLALGKSVELSSQSGLATPGHYAVSGARSGLMRDGCASTGVDHNPWMGVDLREDYLISSVFIVNWKYPEKIISYFQDSPTFKPWNIDLTDVYIGIGRSENDIKDVLFHNGTIEFNATFEFEFPTCGRYVQVRLNATVSLIICGLEVYGKDDGNWTNWGEWSPCTSSCGNGTMSRSRSCESEPCCGSSEQTASCNIHACPECCCYNDEPRDCQDIRDSGHTVSGVYHVTPIGSHEGVDVYCDMETDGGGWLVFQRRVGSTDDFDLNWINYTSGFGEPSASSNFWLGLRHLYQIVSQGHYELRIGNMDPAFDSVYRIFKLGDSGTKYQLTVDDYYGTIEDILSQHNGQLFATKDRPLPELNCTQVYQGGWWLNECAYFSLNGKYEEHGVPVKIKEGSNVLYRLKKTEMKIRRG